MKTPQHELRTIWWKEILIRDRFLRIAKTLLIFIHSLGSWRSAIVACLKLHTTKTNLMRRITGQFKLLQSCRMLNEKVHQDVERSHDCNWCYQPYPDVPDFTKYPEEGDRRTSAHLCWLLKVQHYEKINICARLRDSTDVAPCWTIQRNSKHCTHVAYINDPRSQKTITKNCL